MAPELERYDGPGRGSDALQPVPVCEVNLRPGTLEVRREKAGQRTGWVYFQAGTYCQREERGGGSNMGAKDITVEQFKGTWANYSNRRIEPGNKQDLCYSMRWIIMDV